MYQFPVLVLGAGNYYINISIARHLATCPISLVRFDVTNSTVHAYNLIVNR